MCLTVDLVLPQYRCHLDTYATYALTLSKESLQGAIEALKAANRRWDEVTERSPSIPREIQVCAA